MNNSKNTSPVFIEAKLSNKLNAFIKTNKYSSCFVICDTNTLKYCLSELIRKCPVLKDAEIIELEPGEESKDLNIVNHIWQTLTEFGADKKSLIINLGGGVVSDIGGFAAST
jgi:3-dehydroquinate synthase